MSNPTKGAFDFSQLEVRVQSLAADLNYLKDVLEKKINHEARLYGIREQMKFEINADPEMQGVLAAGEKHLLKSIENSTLLADKLREKILRAMGKL